MKHRRWAGLLLWLAALPALAVPPPFEAVYEVKRNGFTIGEARFRLAEAGPDRFHYSHASRPTGIWAWFVHDRVHERSLWTPTGGGVRPLEYWYERTGGDKERHAHLVFDWTESEVTNHVEGETWRMPIPRGALDKLSVTLALMLDLQAAERTLSYAIADGGRLKTYRFRVIGNETVTAAGRDHATVKLRREREDDDRETLLWCAPALGYLPVKIQQREPDGAVYRSVLRELSVGGDWGGVAKEQKD